MRRKIIAVVLVLSLAVLFAACTGNDNKPSLPSFSFDPGTSFSGADSSTDPSGSDVSVSAQTGEGNTVILTTTPGQTMQTVPTTRFVPEPVTTTQPSTVDPNVSLTVPTMTTPSVITSNNSGGVTYVTKKFVAPKVKTKLEEHKAKRAEKKKVKEAKKAEKAQKQEEAPAEEKPVEKTTKKK